MTSFSLILVWNSIFEELVNAVNPIDPSESIDLQGHDQPIVPFCSSNKLCPTENRLLKTLRFFFLQGMSLEGTYRNAQIPFQNATLGST